MPKKKRNIKNPKKAERKRYIGKKIEILLLVAGLAAGTVVKSHITSRNHGSFGKDSQTTLQLGVAKDNPDDEYDEKIPIYEEGRLIGTLEDGSIILVGPEDKENKGMYEVAGISELGEVVYGTTDEKNFKKEKSISGKDFIEYTEHIYKVKGADTVNIRKSTKLNKDSKIGDINEGEYVFGGEKIVSKDNDFMWVPILYETEDGEIKKAYICYDYVEELDQENEKDNSKKERKPEKKVVNTAKSNNTNLNLRSARIISPESLITSIPNGTVIETTGKEEVVENDIKWTEVKYKDESGTEHVGWVASGYLKNYDYVEYVVNIQENEGHNLNVRKEPGIQSKKIASIENGTRLKIQRDSIESKKEADDIEWVRVDLNDGTYGYVASKYLEEVKEKKSEGKKETEEALSDKEIKDIMENVRVNRDGKVVGIDITKEVSPEELRRLLTKKDAIPKEGKYKFTKQTYNMEDLSGQISYVYIKIGARGYGKKGNMVDYGDSYVELAKVCEELGVPYGFYFYSTALTTEEADEELANIRKAMSSIDERRYNVLPLALDVESCKGSRLEGKDLTDVMAYWANQAEPEFGKVILYTDARHLAEGQDKLIDMKRFNKQMMSGPIKVWLVGFRKADGKSVQDSRQKKINEIASETDICMIQCLLDVYNEEKGLPNIDIDIIDEKEFEKLVKGRVEEVREAESDKEV